MRLCLRTRDRPACVKFHAVVDTQFRVSVFYAYRDTVLLILVQYGASAPRDSKMGTEVVGTLTHADAAQRGNTPHPAYVYHAL
jgi:hypothetical protein